jgi:hypothetical protein
LNALAWNTAVLENIQFRKKGVAIEVYNMGKRCVGETVHVFS